MRRALDLAGGAAVRDRIARARAKARAHVWQPPPQYTDVVHREHAVVETGGVRTARAMGLRVLPSKSWPVNCGRVIAAQSVTEPREP